MADHSSCYNGCNHSALAVSFVRQVAGKEACLLDACVFNHERNQQPANGRQPMWSWYRIAASAQLVPRNTERTVLVFLILFIMEPSSSMQQSTSLLIGMGDLQRWSR
jgi:hypothetical protein